MRPTKGDVHVNTPLTNMSIAYLQDATNFVATQVFPNLPVTKQSDRYWTYDRGEFNRDEMKQRAPGTESAGGSYKLDSTPTYYADVWAFHKDIPDQVRANSDSVLDDDRDATEFVTLKGLIKREKLWATTYFATSIWQFEKAGAASASSTQVIYWDNASSTPIEDVRTAKRTVQQNTGFKPNTLVLGKAVYDSLVDNPEIIERIDRGQTPNGPALGNIEGLKRIFEIERIFVMEAIENTANEDASDYDHDADNSSYYSHDFIGGNHALLCYSAPRPGLRTPSAGYTFSWTGYLGAGAEGNRIKRFYIDKIASDRVELEMAFDLKMIAQDMGYFFKDLLTP